MHVDPDLWTVHHYTQDPAELDRLPKFPIEVLRGIVRGERGG